MTAATSARQRVCAARHQGAARRDPSKFYANNLLTLLDPLSIVKTPVGSGHGVIPCPAPSFFFTFLAYPHLPWAKIILPYYLLLLDFEVFSFGHNFERLKKQPAA
jgi:hypothetical protein